MDIQLFPHQERALEQTEQFNNVAYYLDMGLGKTFVGSEKLWELNSPYNLVICQKSKLEDWYQHFKEYYSDDYKVILFDREKLEYIEENSILIINYEKAIVRPELKKIRNFTLLLDESQYIKNPKSQRTKLIMNELKPSNVILLSGTPIDGKYEELLTQINLLGWKIKEKMFLSHYTNREWDEKEMKYKIVGYKNIDRLKRKLRDYGCVFMKTEEVFDLPSQTDIFLKPKKTKSYDEFIREGIVQLKERKLIAETASVGNMNARLLCTAFNQNKLSMLKDLLESTEDRLIIFYQYNLEKEAIGNLAKELNKPISYINGDLVDKNAYENKKNSITLVQYQSGSFGHNLQKANKIIFFGLPNRVSFFEQSRKRTHRIGQERPCFYYYMLTLGTYEWKNYQTLVDGKDYNDELFKEDTRCDKDIQE
ncbi:DEAD/DEAH box helicase family protein [Staphylococcus epidermidis]|uniref:SNF2-related protein n=1 Tax=Staphylococcus epidermidis TaxID=1282 RepID=UPI0020042601|nr:SNF2-related protein [Staphylococcus epidermidis]MCG1234817.1 DEAD/DEAH box helicase family protein [Staphylococcus epidermidis]MCG1250898.1 DEAD/DEAH box helicase family protein [Staphylococcus epidermidis]MCG1254175.1 DEAD/DEAH box helicase family protein [Staphylococcus epidermidis]MCG1406773.1 DEAD/DEAH box helicase family protein [Staphylococcus epidermidis]MCG1411456.1 DEAD/DEAH box helicase family protein [Staphylococcus epidermidis]